MLHSRKAVSTILFILTMSVLMISVALAINMTCDTVLKFGRFVAVENGFKYVGCSVADDIVEAVVFLPSNSNLIYKIKIPSSFAGVGYDLVYDVVDDVIRVKTSFYEYDVSVSGLKYELNATVRSVGGAGCLWINVSRV